MLLILYSYSIKVIVMLISFILLDILNQLLNSAVNNDQLDSEW